MKDRLMTGRIVEDTEGTLRLVIGGLLVAYKAPFGAISFNMIDDNLKGMISPSNLIKKIYSEPKNIPTMDLGRMLEDRNVLGYCELIWERE